MSLQGLGFRYEPDLTSLLCQDSALQYMIRLRKYYKSCMLALVVTLAPPYAFFPGLDITTTHVASE